MIFSNFYQKLGCLADSNFAGNFSKKVETDRVLKLRGKNNQKVAGRFSLLCLDHVEMFTVCVLPP